MRQWLKRSFGVRRGVRAQTTAEYAIIVTLVALTSIAVILIFGNQLRAVFAAGAKRMASDEPVQVENKADGADAATEGRMTEF